MIEKHGWRQCFVLLFSSFPSNARNAAKHTPIRTTWIDTFELFTNNKIRPRSGTGLDWIISSATGYSRYCCTMVNCRKSFANKQNLDRHIRTGHQARKLKSVEVISSLCVSTDMRSFQCFYCDEWVPSLELHLTKTHHSRSVDQLKYSCLILWWSRRTNTFV